MDALLELYERMGISPGVYAYGEKILDKLADRFAAVDKVAEYNQAKVLAAMQKNRVSAACFVPSTGYGYDDTGRDCLERDVRTGKGYFLEEDGIPLGYLCVDFDGEPAYDHLNGTWAREEPYVVVHRLALSDAARGRGAAGTAFQLVEDLCRARGVREFRVDTDAGNHKMQHILAKQGFQYRGTIRFDNSEKIAYEKRL